MIKPKRFETISQLLDELRNSGLASMDRPHLNLCVVGKQRPNGNCCLRSFDLVSQRTR